MTHRIDAATARRFLAIRHLLAPPRALPGTTDSVMSVVDRLGSLQFDPLEVAGRNHDLVLAARIDGYRRGLTEELLYGRRLLFEAYNKSLNVLPTRELPWYRITWEPSQHPQLSRVLHEQRDLVDKVMTAIEAEGPKSSADFERLPAIAWWWGPTSAVRAVLEALNVCGRIGLARREGNRRYFDLTERLYPSDLLAVRVPEREQVRHKLLSRFRAHGLLGKSGSGELWLGIPSGAVRTSLRDELLDRGELLEVEVEGLRGTRYVIADELPMLAQAQRELAAEAAGAAPRPGDGAPGCSFVAPLDPIMWDRQVLAPLYGFEYKWEVYTPAAKRRWGYYVLPVMFGDRLVGRIEPRFDRVARVVRILSLGWEPWFEPLETPGFDTAFAGALNAHAAFGGYERVAAPAGKAHKPLFAAIADRVTVARGAAARGGAGSSSRSRPAGS